MNEAHQRPLAAAFRRVNSLLIAVIACACENSPQPVRTEPVPAAELMAKTATPAMAAAIAATAAPKIESIAPKKVIAWQAKSGPLADPERAVVGTWVATVGDYASRSAFMADKVMFDLRGGGKSDAISAIADAITNDNRVQTNCVWLELFETRTGIRRECALVGGQASALDQTDFFTGKKSDLGTKFEWSWDEKAKVVRVLFDADMLVPASDGKAIHNLRFRHWVLAFGEKSGEGIKIKESIPEHDYQLPVQYVFEIFPGRFLGRQ